MTRHRGFTTVELVLSAAILALLLLSGVVAARSATTVAQDSIGTSAAEGRALRAHEQIRQLLLAAGRGTLEALPAGGGPLEAMQDGVAYDNVSFRRTVTNGPAGQVLEPAVGDPPFTLAFQQRGPAGGDGELVWTDEHGSRSLASGVQGVEFVRTGSRVTVRITAVTRGTRPETRTAVRSLVLRNP